MLHLRDVDLRAEPTSCRAPRLLVRSCEMATATATRPKSGESAANKAPKHEDQAPNEKEAAPRKLLLILHGRRLDDDLVREAIQQLKSEGHEVSSVALDCSTCEHVAAFKWLQFTAALLLSNKAILERLAAL